MKDNIKFFIGNEGTDKLTEASKIGEEINSLEEELANTEKNWELAYYYAKEYEEKIKKADAENKITLNELKIKLHEIKEKLKEFGENSKKIRGKIKEIREKQSELANEIRQKESGKIN